MTNIDFPLHFDHRGRTARVDHAGHVRDMIEQLLFTAPGERVNRPDFGCGLMELVFSPNSPELAAVLEATAHAALLQHLGDLIVVESFTVKAEDATLSVRLVYRLLATGERRTEVFERGYR
ncbi:GPW/gp25 family protein [Allokutzneria multivorans]|uniref:GPW/gp25 family protein n=1 Tax=Allokutzneria multivorans TaxID=1142134 RepID=A0ABP7S2J3_9PSEU